MPFPFSPKRRKNYSIDRLRVLYTDLIQHIDFPDEHLGRRAVNDEDRSIHNKSMRFSFRRKLIPDNLSDTFEIETRDNPNIDFAVGNEVVSLLAAFRMLAATKSPDKEGDHLGAATRDEYIVAAMSSAKKVENRVVEILEEIGEIVVHVERTATDIRADPVFEYFCEKNILSLIADIAKTNEKKSMDTRLSDTSCYGVVWSPLVKAQCFRTTSMILSNVQDSSVVYYLLSHNYINEQIMCMTPFQQWTHSSLTKMIPEFVDLLKNATIQLTDDPSLFPFLIIDDPESESTKFPLFSTALELAISDFAQSDSAVYNTCITVVVNLMKIKSKSIEEWFMSASSEQRKLADHLSQRIMDRYNRICDLCTGPVVDFVRSNNVNFELKKLYDDMGVIRDVFWSTRGLDVRLCESLLQRVVAILLKNLLPPRQDSQFLDVGVVDSDVIPQREARAQVSTLFLAFLFSNLAYRPFQRMLAVAILHPVSTPLWLSLRSVKQFGEDEYVFMPALSDIVTGEESRKEVCENRFRTEVLHALEGKYGDWRFISSACLIQTIFNEEAIVNDCLTLMDILPHVDDNEYTESPLEYALVTFLKKKHKPSRIVSQALECAGQLSIELVNFSVKHCDTISETTATEKLDYVLTHSKAWSALGDAYHGFCAEAAKLKSATGVSDIFLDLLETTIRNRYKPKTLKSGITIYSCSLSHQGFNRKLSESEILVRKNRDCGTSDVESARFFISMALHYRALHKMIDRKLRLSLNVNQEPGPLDFVDEADFLTRTIGRLDEKHVVGTEMDLTGRMTFRFHLPGSPKTSTKKDSPKGKSKTSVLILVLDPTDMYVVRPILTRRDENYCSVLHSISLRSVIAAAADGNWLHVAVRHADIDMLIKNGNMAVEFENTGASLIVKQYLDRSREVLRQEMLTKVTEFLPL